MRIVISFSELAEYGQDVLAQACRLAGIPVETRIVSGDSTAPPKHPLADSEELISLTEVQARKIGIIS